MALKPSKGAVWVTGASSGLGRALALRLARAGFTVAISARSAAGLEEAAKEAAGMKGRLLPYPCDIKDRDAVLKTLAEMRAAHGPIQLAVLNAGTHQEMHAHNFSSETFRKLIEINVMGQVHCLEALLPEMLSKGEGHIALVSSVAGYVGLPSAAAYGLTKAGLINMAESLRPELKKRGIKLQLVNPGFVKTPLTDKNEFPMPFLLPVDVAAERFYRGLKSARWEITFPRRLALILKLMRILPAPVFFAITATMAPK